MNSLHGNGNVADIVRVKELWGEEVQLYYCWRKSNYNRMGFENIYISCLSPPGSEGEVTANERSDTCGVCELETESHNFDSMTFLQGLGHLGNSLPAEASQKTRLWKHLCCFPRGNISGLCPTNQEYNKFWETPTAPLPTPCAHGALPNTHLRGPVPCSTENEGLQFLVSEVGTTIMNEEVMERWERKKSGTFVR